MVPKRLHSVRGAAHSSRHIPVVHVCPMGHTLPHAPQFITSFWASTQFAPHARRGNMQLHVPPTHPTPGGHVVRHDPQLELSVCRFTHIELHSDCPIVHPEFESSATSGAIGTSVASAASTRDASRTSGTSEVVIMSPHAEARTAVNGANNATNSGCRDRFENKCIDKSSIGACDASARRNTRYHGRRRATTADRGSDPTQRRTVPRCDATRMVAP